MELVTLKHKVRNLKNLEIQIRFGKKNYNKQQLVWNDFFDLKGNREVKYPLQYLLLIDNNEYRRIADEFLAFVYRDLFKHFDIPNNYYFDKHLLIKLDLPYDADIRDVKKRFRDLAKKYHPDKGGDSRKFIELMEIYNKLISENKKIV